MPATTLSAIVTLMQALVEAAPLALVRTTDPFTHDLQPNSAVDNSYRIEDAGQVSRTSVTNNAEARVHRLTVWIAKPLAFAGDAQWKAMEDLFDALYRQLVAQGRTQGWNIEAEGQRVTQPPTGDVLIGSLTVTVDFDYDASVAA